LAGGHTVREAAAAAGVSERTAHRRLADPTFAARVTELRSRMVESATGRLADGMSEAVGVLRSLLGHDNPAVRLRAAGKLIDLGVKLVAEEETARRLDAMHDEIKRLEADLQQKPPGV
jgi:uncharacterized small protein (DUF1192 family)